MDIHATAFLIMGIITFTFNCGPNFMKENREFLQKLVLVKPEAKEKAPDEAKEREDLLAKHEEEFG